MSDTMSKTYTWSKPFVFWEFFFLGTPSCVSCRYSSPALTLKKWWLNEETGERDEIKNWQRLVIKRELASEHQKRGKGQRHQHVALEVALWALKYWTKGCRSNPTHITLFLRHVEWWADYHLLHQAAAPSTHQLERQQWLYACFSPSVEQKELSG